jgi:4-alpha-glucanotransferase
MEFPRGSGILLHVTSLPSRFGIGDLGPAAYQFVDFLAATGQSLWQMLPVGPTGYGNSPYQSLSSFAGNTQLISLDRLADDELLEPMDEQTTPDFSRDAVDFELVETWKERQLRSAHRKFLEIGQTANEFDEFCKIEAWWLDDYAAYRAAKRTHDERAWTEWLEPLVRRDPAALEHFRDENHHDISREKFLQFQFERQWRALKAYANERRVLLVGDLPIFVAHDSADAWANQELFRLDERGRPTVIAGVPPDYFSKTGQRWGNPLYRWEVHAQQGYAWWTRRLRRAIELFDIVRIDHFRGFESYWEIPAAAEDARPGKWSPGPGAAPFLAAQAALGPLSVIAEDLGVITPPVEALRDSLGFPGMRVLQFAFGDDPKGSDYRPHNYPRHCVVYTGTHDNNTTVGWFTGASGVDTTRTPEQVARENATALDYLGSDGREIHWDIIRAAWGSVADIAIAPLQDVLGLGAEARMNLPGSATGNWRWRFREESLTPDIAQRLGRLTTLFDRAT